LEVSPQKVSEVLQTYPVLETLGEWLNGQKKTQENSVLDLPDLLLRVVVLGLVG
jgi:hypothetical protein